jgi:TetR/AcrR family transcriptional regulator, ethionamide resistance regulator
VSSDKGLAHPSARNATEEAIVDAARDALAEVPFRQLTMETIAQRAFVSRTALYFYFPNKRAVIDRLIQQTFTDTYEAASPYIEGRGDPRKELYVALTQVIEIVDRDGHVLMLAAGLSGEEDHLPPEWAPYVARFFDGCASRIARDQQAGIAPTDIPPRLAAQALVAMVERHVTLELISGGGDAHQTIKLLAELWWRAVYWPPREDENSSVR